MTMVVVVMLAKMMSMVAMVLVTMTTSFASQANQGATGRRDELHIFLTVSSRSLHWIDLSSDDPVYSDEEAVSYVSIALSGSLSLTTCTSLAGISQRDLLRFLHITSHLPRIPEIQSPFWLYNTLPFGRSLPTRDLRIRQQYQALLWTRISLNQKRSRM
jgi:hypothetical protein